ncbi:MAG: hypothetical protein QOH08_1143 [Chloroflexota bacterium]|jgi:hypothetical protein|nr:hypothetical protein [Chloroflexota bacterium]
MRFFAFAIVMLLLVGAVGVGAYEAGLAAAGVAATGAAPAAYPYAWHPGFFFFPFGFLLPLFFLFLFFGLMRAAFGHSRSGGGYGGYWGRPRMLDEWHKELHERDKTGAEKADR